MNEPIILFKFPDFIVTIRLFMGYNEKDHDGPQGVLSVLRKERPQPLPEGTIEKETKESEDTI